MSPPEEIGVLLYLPVAIRGQELRAQGLVRHALTVTAALASRGDAPMTVFTPRWAREEIESALVELGAPTGDRLRVRSPRRASPAELVTRAILRVLRPDRRGWSGRRVRAAGHAATGDMRWAVTSWPRLVVVGVVGVLLAATAAVLGWWLVAAVAASATAVAMLGLLAVAALAVVWAATRLPHPRRVARRVVGPMRSGRSRVRGTVNLVIEDADVAYVVAHANRTGIRRWWIPIGMYPATARLRGARITTFADFVPAEFPGMLADSSAYRIRRGQMASLLGSSHAIVCLSDHVRTRHLPFVAPTARAVHVIPPGPPVRGARLPSVDPVGELCARLREQFPGSRAAVEDWWRLPTIIVPSQSRPYKNLGCLVEAVGILSRRRYTLVRLVLTARPDRDGLADLAFDSGNAAFVEFLPDLPDDVLDLALGSAALAMTPSLFEASLPFTLFESVSVGTPCLMADIPVTRAAMVGHASLAAATLVDATDPRRVADAIARALAGRADLLAAQRTFLDEYYAINSWERCAARYAEVLAGAGAS